LILLVFGTSSAHADFAISRKSPDIAAVSGERGDRVSTAKEISRGKAGIGLTLFFAGEISCGVALEGRKLGKNANFETEKLNFCSGGRGARHDKTLEVRYGWHLTGLRVCTSTDEPARIGGFEIAGGKLDEAGRIVASGGTRRYRGAGCNRWGAWSDCDEDHVVTGFVARFKNKERGSDLPDALVGLQAVCRAVEKR
jgi:hypothetical protein